MSGRLPLTIACASYDRTHALESASIRPAGIDLNFVSVNPGETFWRQLRFAEFDVAEMSMSAYIMLTARGDTRFVAIPAFTSRAFRHDCIFVSASSGITKPDELAGTRVGVPQYHMTAALWIRGILSDDYGVATSSITWVQGGLDSPGYPERIELQLPASIRLERTEGALSDLLLSGEIAAIIGAEWPKPFRDGDSRIRQLFPNYEVVEREYYRRTHFFPIMHGVVIKKEIYRNHPWVARSLFDAFCQAKQRVMSRMSFPGAPITILPWQVSAHLDAMRSMGEDYWPYGVGSNRHELQAMCRYSLEQGLSASLVDVDTLFAPETIDALPLSATNSPLATNA
jgi:4,5-dihydroxyphthalate decarboxylase